VLRSHALDAQPLLPYLTNPGQASLRKTNFTQTGTNLQAPPPIPPCVLPVGNTKVCTQIFPFQDLCVTEGGTWYGPVGDDPGLQTCCQVKNGPDPNVTLLAHDAWAVRDDRYKLVRLQQEDCNTNQLYITDEFYAIDEVAPIPLLDREGRNLLPIGLTPAQAAHFRALLAKLLAIERSEPDCPGDGNLDKRVDQADLDNWAVFATKCAQNQNQCSSVYDLNYDAVTDSADRLIIAANFGRRCGVRGFLR
jgi:hypothetical protein